MPCFSCAALRIDSDQLVLTGPDDRCGAEGFISGFGVGFATGFTAAVGTDCDFATDTIGCAVGAGALFSITGGNAACVIAGAAARTIVGCDGGAREDGGRDDGARDDDAGDAFCLPTTLLATLFAIGATGIAGLRTVFVTTFAFGLATTAFLGAGFTLLFTALVFILVFAGAFPDAFVDAFTRALGFAFAGAIDLDLPIDLDLALALVIGCLRVSIED